VTGRALRVTNLREQGMRRLSRNEARDLQRVFRLGREVAATRIELGRSGRRVSYSMRRNAHELLNGVLTADETRGEAS
jgi:hypothetical protein